MGDFQVIQDKWGSQTKIYVAQWQNLGVSIPRRILRDTKHPNRSFSALLFQVVLVDLTVRYICTFLGRAEIVASFSAICVFNWVISAFADFSAISSGLNKGARISWYFFTMESLERDSRKFNLKLSILSLVWELSAIFGQELEDLNLFFQVDMSLRKVYSVTAVFSDTGGYSKNSFSGTEASWLTYCAVQCSLGTLSTYKFISSSIHKEAYLHMEGWKFQEHIFSCCPWLEHPGILYSHTEQLGSG